MQAFDNRRKIGIAFDAAKNAACIAGGTYVSDPENTVRWNWRMGDVAMWDNRATQHRSVPDHGDAPRKLRRSTVLGTVPTAIDGRRSRRLDA